ncbi:MAG: helix-turn-helix domain-containing protein [Planctomycetes bacterium]|nr:helix-turn-helix domain-containing protein [Planctomycetota bacterium]
MNASELALWRYSVLAPLLHAAPNMSLAEIARQLSVQPKVGPDGTPVALSAETILRWYTRYRASGVEGLEKKSRKDRGAPARDRRGGSAPPPRPGRRAPRVDGACHPPGGREARRPSPARAAARARAAPRPRHPANALACRYDARPLRLRSAPREVEELSPRVHMDDASRAIMAARFALSDDVAALIPILREALLARGDFHAWGNVQLHITPPASPGIVTALGLS